MHARMRRSLGVSIRIQNAWTCSASHRGCRLNLKSMPELPILPSTRAKSSSSSSTSTPVEAAFKARPRKASNASDRRRSCAEPIKGELVFGVHPVTLALEAGRRKPYHLYVKDNRLENPSDAVAHIMELCFKQKLPIYKRDADWISSHTGSDMHQGICLDCSKLNLRTFDRSAVPQNSRNDLWLLLDGIEDPMNLGALLRSAQFFGIQNVVVTETNASPFTALVNKASSGAMELLKLHMMPLAHMEKTLRHMRHEKFHLVAALSKNELSERREGIARHIDAVHNINSFNWRGNTILIMGNESRGIRDEILKHCNHFVNVASPMDDFSSSVADENQKLRGVGSLNVSACGAVMLHQLAVTRAAAVARQRAKKVEYNNAADAGLSMPDAEIIPEKPTATYNDEADLGEERIKHFN